MADKGNSCFWLATVKIIYSSETAWPNGAELDRKHLCKVLYKVSSFRSVWPTNMAAKSNSCFWLANVKKIFSETAWPNGAKLYRKHLCKVLYKVSSFRSVWPTHMAAKSNSCYGSMTSSNLHHIFMSRSVSQLQLEIYHLYLFYTYIVRCTCQSARCHLTLTSFSCPVTCITFSWANLFLNYYKRQVNYIWSIITL
jgi:hypothetical protein